MKNSITALRHFVDKLYVSKNYNFLLFFNRKTDSYVTASSRQFSVTWLGFYPEAGRVIYCLWFSFFISSFLSVRRVGRRRGGRRRAWLVVQVVEKLLQAGIIAGNVVDAFNNKYYKSIHF